VLPKSNRLVSTYDYRRVLGSKRRYHTPLFTLVVAFSRSDQHPPRFGFVCSKKIDKRAVVRNKVRRWLQHSAREVYNRIPNGFDLIFLAKKPIVNSSYAQIVAQLNQVLSKISFDRPRMDRSSSTPLR